MNLRPYQKAAVRMVIHELRTTGRALCVAATGAGKTEMFIDIARQARSRVCVLVGRDKLVEQTARRMRAVIPDTAVWSAGQGEKRIADSTVVSIHSADTLTIDDLGLIIIDEAHNANSGRYARFIERHKSARIAGFTATPWRNAKPIWGEGKLFPSVTYRVELLKLINEGYLVPPVIKAMPEGFDTKGLSVRGGEFVMSELAELTRDGVKIRAQVRDALPRLEDRKKVVWTCTSIEHAQDVFKVLQAMGEHAVLVHSKVRDIDFAMECFERGHLRHAVSVMMLTEGIDIPAVDAICLMRPTRSPTLMTQTIGRGLRLYEGKKDCAILDYGQVIANCGPVNDPYIKEDKPSAAKKEAFKPSIRVCPNCLSYVPVDEPVCPDCGHEDKKVIDRLRELTRKAAMDAVLAESEPVEWECSDVMVGQYKSRNGNDCIRLTFNLRHRVSPFHVYGSSHPFSWGKFRQILEALCDFRFDSWQECFDECERLNGSLTIPSRVVLKREGQYDKLVRLEE